MGAWELEITNIGGIRSGRTTLRPGTNVVRASNWQGKSSLLKAIQTVMGTTGIEGTPHPLTERAESGEVTLQTDESTYRTRLERRGGRIVRSGETYLRLEDDESESAAVNAVCARLFAFLGEDNPVREAVRTGGNLADVLTRPLDVENVEERIADLERERDRVERRLEDAEEAAAELAETEREIAQLETELETLRTEYENVDRDPSGEDGPREELSEARQRRDRLANQVERLESQLDRIESQLERKRDRLAELDVPDEPTLETDVESKRRRIEELDAKIDLLETVWRANQRVLDEGELELLSEIEHGLIDDDVDCWVCGGTVSRSQIVDRLETIRDRLESFREERRELREDVDEIEQMREEIRSKRREERDLEAAVSELQTRRQDTRADLDDAKSELSAAEAALEELEEHVEETDDRLADLRSDIGRTEAELETARTRLETVRPDAEKLDDYRARYERLTDELEDLRGRKYRKKRELAEEFGSTMEEIIEVFDPGFEAARLEVKTEGGEIVDYELVVAREGAETSLDALSEGELELLGIVAAIAGYETFDVDEYVPVILLDGIGALASQHVHTLVEYLGAKAEFLVTTAYPEIESFDGHTVSPEEWTVVSRDEGVTP